MTEILETKFEKFQNRLTFYTTLSNRLGSDGLLYGAPSLLYLDLLFALRKPLWF